jgi:hypothetical protein
MARENRRKREERRFGRPPRLADLIVGTEPKRWIVSRSITIELSHTPSMKDFYQNLIISSIAGVSDSKIIVSDNVFSYYCDHEKCVWDIEDIPNAAPPFGSFFIEFRTPPKIRVEGGVERSSAGSPELAGCLFTVLDPSQYDYSLHVSLGQGGHEFKRFEDAKWFIAGMVFLCNNGSPVFCGVCRVYPVGADGRILACPASIVFGDHTEMIANHGRELVAGVYDFWYIPALLSISFMNCKNVRLDPVDPDPIINRNRRVAGLKPFLRYHTINIEPMKHVLRTEGNIEAEGLKRALHICRGHFATYSAEKPLFGRVVGTVWRPSHVRGSAKEGVIFSDYNVNPPRDN